MASCQRFSEYRIMWVLVFFDLPTDTRKHRKTYATFRKALMQDGFSMIQFSIYARHCASAQNATVHVQRVKNMLPNEGNICIMTITDKQFGNMEIFNGRSPDIPKCGGQQLELF